MAARGLIDYSDSDEESSEQSAPVVGLREPSQLPISEELTGSASAVCEVAHASPRSRSRLGDSGDDSENLKLDASSQAEPASVAVTDRSHHIDTEVDGAAGPGRSVLGTKRRRLDALPPSADEDAPPAVVQRFQEYLRLSAAGHNFTSVLRRKKDFGNPCILDKVIQHYGIDHIGTAHAPAVLDPHGYAPCEYYRALAEAQRRAEEERAARQSSAVRSSIAFAAESAATAGAAAGGAVAAFNYTSAPVLSGSRHLGAATATAVAAMSFAPSGMPPGTAVPMTSTAGADSTLNLAVARARAAALTVAAGAGTAQDKSSSGRMPSKWDR